MARRLKPGWISLHSVKHNSAVEQDASPSAAPSEADREALWQLSGASEYEWVPLFYHETLRSGSTLGWLLLIWDCLKSVLVLQAFGMIQVHPEGFLRFMLKHIKPLCAGTEEAPDKQVWRSSERCIFLDFSCLFCSSFFFHLGFWFSCSETVSAEILWVTSYSA